MRRIAARTTKLQRHGWVWIAIAIYIWSTVKLADRMGDASKAHPSSSRALTDRISNVCICIADSRYSKRDLLLADMRSFEELQGFIEQDPEPIDEWGYWRKTALINKAYALRFSHDFIVSDLSAYQSVFNSTRSAVWLKPAFMLDMQYKRPDCQWFPLMDSDAYFWMANHTVALPDWFATKSLHEATARYHHFEEEKRIRRGYYDWNDFDAFLLIGLNGVFSEPHEGYPNVYGGKEHDFMCAGVYFITNSDISKEFLRDWVYGPIDSTEEERAILAEYAHKFPLEQHVLNAVLYPRYKNQIHIHSYRDFASIEGTRIRHIWSQFGDMRASLIDADLTSIRKGQT